MPSRTAADPPDRAPHPRSAPGGAGPRIGFHERGSGPPALLVHGFTGSAAAWSPAIIDGLAAAHRVIAVELPGHGSAAPCPTPASWALERVVDALCALLDGLAIEQALWVGYSMGGRVCLGAAALRPERVQALVLESASPGLEAPEQRAARRVADEALARALERDGIAAFVEHWMAQPLFASQRTLGPARLAAERRRRLACDAPSLAACLRGLGTGSQPSFWGALGKLRARSLLLAGERDAKFSGIAARMGAAIPDATVRIVPGAGHATHLERPDAWLAAVRRFARGVETRGAGR